MTGEATPGHTGTGRSPTRRAAWSVSAALVLLVALVYAQVARHDFVNMDDPEYLTRNPWVSRGLSWEGVAWAFSSFHASNWHPLTWLSHMVDVSLFGLQPGPHHLVSVALHALVTLALFWFLRAATGATAPSAATEAVFGIHPLHVESVAWISERKDLLSALFLLLALRAWVAYARRPRPAPYLTALGLVALGLLSKPMVVTAPVLLLLVDVWPLGRLGGSGDLPRPWLRRAPGLLLELVPFGLLSAALSVVTVMAQSAGGQQGALSELPLGIRLSNAAVSISAYLGKLFWPSGLAAFYPHPYTGQGIQPSVLVASVGVLLAVSALALLERRRRPCLAWGWLWFLVSLLPVLGLVQVGSQAMADRYMYLPMIGPVVAVSWTVAALLERGRAWRAALAAGGAACAIALAVAAHRQVAVWRNSLVLWQHAIAVTQGNWKAWSGLADAHFEDDRMADGIAAARESLRILPTNSEAWGFLGAASLRHGQHAEASASLEEAVRLAPGFVEAWYNLGIARAGLGRLDDAVVAFGEALRLEAGYADAWHNLGAVHLRLGQVAEAVRCLREATRLRPDDAQSWGLRALSEARSGDRGGALQSIDRLERLDARAAGQLRIQLAPPGP